MKAATWWFSACRIRASVTIMITSAAAKTSMSSASADPTRSRSGSELEKRIKHNDPVANAVAVHNVLAITHALKTSCRQSHARDRDHQPPLTIPHQAAKRFDDHAQPATAPSSPLPPTTSTTRTGRSPKSGSTSAAVRLNPDERLSRIGSIWSFTGRWHHPTIMLGGLSDR
jgi:hypothetical protein